MPARLASARVWPVTSMNRAANRAAIKSSAVTTVAPRGPRHGLCCRLVSGNGDALNQSLDDVIAGDTPAASASKDTMSRCRRQSECNRLHIVRADVIPPGNPRVGAGAAVQGDRRPRAGPVLQPAGQLTVVVARLARAHNQLDDVFLNGGCHMDAQSRFARLRKYQLGDTVPSGGCGPGRFIARQPQMACSAPASG